MGHANRLGALLLAVLLAPAVAANDAGVQVYNDDDRFGETSCSDGAPYYERSTRHGARVRVHEHEAMATVVTHCSAEDFPTYERTRQYLGVNVTAWDHSDEDAWRTIVLEWSEYKYQDSGHSRHYCDLDADYKDAESKHSRHFRCPIGPPTTDYLP